MSQIIQFGAPSGLTGVTANLFVPTVDTVVAAQSATGATNAKGTFFATFSGLTPGTYQLIAFGATGYPVANWLVDVGSSGSFLAYDGPSVDSRPISILVPPAVVAASMDPQMIAITTFNVCRYTLVMGAIGSRTGLWFCLKANPDDPDSAALILISEAGGLLVANGSPASNAALGSLTVTDSTAGTVNLYVHESITGLITPTNGPFDLYWWDSKVRVGTDTTAPQSGRAVVAPGITRAY